MRDCSTGIWDDENINTCNHDCADTDLIIHLVLNTLVPDEDYGAPNITGALLGFTSSFSLTRQKNLICHLNCINSYRWYVHQVSVCRALRIRKASLIASSLVMAVAGTRKHYWQFWIGI